MISSEVKALKIRDWYRMKRAAYLAKKWHRGQVDKDGKDYFLHLKAVAETAYAMTGSPRAYIVGMLHDCIEDRKATYRQVDQFGLMVSMSVWRLTKRRGQTREDYILDIGVKDDPVVLAVKIADLLHNTSPSRNFDVERNQKYADELWLLTSARARSHHPSLPKWSNPKESVDSNG